MYALQKAENSYFRNNPIISNHPRSEQAVIARVNEELKESAKNKDERYAIFAQALDRNRKLWIAIASDVADSGNLLPEKLRAQLFYLAEFVIQHTTKVLKGTESEEILLEINQYILNRDHGAE